jgi:hypothetical protein
LLVYFFRQFLLLKVGVLLEPAVSFHNLGRISRRCENLGNQGIRVQCNWRNQLLELFGGLLRDLSWNRWRRLICLSYDYLRHGCQQE